MRVGGRYPVKLRHRDIIVVLGLHHCRACLRKRHLRAEHVQLHAGASDQPLWASLSASCASSIAFCWLTIVSCNSRT